MVAVYVEMPPLFSLLLLSRRQKNIRLLLRKRKKQNSGLTMKQNISVIAALLAVMLITACGTKQSGQLTGVLERPTWKGINPYGMVYIPSGTLHIGASDQDISGTFLNAPKSISISVKYLVGSLLWFIVIVYFALSTSGLMQNKKKMDRNLGHENG